MVVGEEHLFWLVLLAFVVFDNAVLLPHGLDFLRVGYSGGLRYDAKPRITLMGRDLVFSNPLNPYDRVVVSTKVAGQMDAKAYAAEARKIRTEARASNRLSHLGAVYWLVVAAHLTATAFLNGSVVILSLLICHLVIWCVAAAVLVFHRAALGFDRARIINLLVEHLLVPGYMPQLGKRLWPAKRLELPTLAFGLRQAMQQQRVGSGDALFVHRLHVRLADASGNMAGGATADSTSVESSKGVGTRSDAGIDGEMMRWFGEAEQCLKALMQPDG